MSMTSAPLPSLHDQPVDIARLVDLLVAHELQQLFGRTFVAQPQRRPNGSRGSHGRRGRHPRSRARGCRPSTSTSAKPSPSGPAKCSRFSPKSRLALETGDALLRQALFPEAERTLRNRKDRRADFADARAALADVREREIGHDGAGRAVLVAVIEMIDVGRVEIDGLLDAAQAERVGEELVVLACIRRHRGDVVQALDLVEHCLAPSFAIAAAAAFHGHYVGRPGMRKGGQTQNGLYQNVNDQKEVVHHCSRRTCRRRQIRSWHVVPK